jgi:hypothetical protein
MGEDSMACKGIEGACVLNREIEIQMLLTLAEFI